MSKKNSFEPHLRGLVDLVSSTVDQGSRGVESVHRKIADVPFSVLKKVKPIAPLTGFVHSIEKKVTHSAYDTVRLISKVSAQVVHNALPTDPNNHGIAAPQYTTQTNRPKQPPKKVEK